CEPRSPLGAVLLGVADDGHGTCYEQPSQVAITLLGDAAEPLLAAGRVLLGHQPDPGSKIAPRAELPPVADFGNQRGGHDWADARDLLQATARFARAMPGEDTFVDWSNLGTDRAVLPCQHIEKTADRWGDPVICYVRDDAKQLTDAIASLRRHDAQFRQVPAQGVAQHRALTHQQLPGSVQHQASLLLFRLDWNKPHRWPHHCLADRSRIVRIVLAALEIGLHITRRHQPHAVAERL